MAECNVNKKNEKDDLEYMNVDALEPMEGDDFDEISVSFVRLHDPAEDEEK